MGNPKTATGPQAAVREVMASVTIEASPDDTLAAVAAVMADNEIGALPIVADGELRGILTERDLVRAMAHGVDAAQERAGDRMSVQAQSVGPDTAIDVATGRMLEAGIRHLPVVEGGRVVGIVSMRDLLAAYSTFVEE